MPSGLRWCLVFGLAATVASAQEFELDLSDDSPTGPSELRPTLALLEVVASEGDEVSASRARQLEAELLTMWGKADQFQSVLSPLQVKAQAADLLTNCTDRACFQAARQKLKVHRVVRLTVQRQGAGSLVTLFGFDPSLPELIKTTLDSAERAEKVFMGMAGRTQAQRDRDFLRKLVPMVRTSLRKLATSNGKIIIDNRDPAVTVLIDGEPVGAGRVEAVAQRGARTVSIDGSIYEPFSQVVTVEPLKTANVEVRLIAKPIARVAKKEAAPAGVPLFQRPGIYVAFAGVVAAAVGVGLGVSTTAVQQRIDAGGRPVAVTRAEALDAATNAVLANVLVGGGAALVAGGITWVALTPAPSNSSIGEPTETAGPSGWMLSLGGTF